MATIKGKTGNKKRFKFRSFNEQISSIKIDVVHRINQSIESTLPPEEQSFFQEALLKWRELNCSNSFIEFHDEVFEKTQSLPLLVHHKDFIVEKFKTHLQNKDMLELEPLLDLLVQLARDLQDDFYPYFEQFFPILVSLCNLPDAKIIEQVFTCLAYLFKFLWRQMLRDITNVFQLYSKLLLSWQRDYIRQFAVESFGFLLRKVRNIDGLCVLMLQSVSIEPEVSNGMGQLLFEVCKGVQKQFHSCTEKFLSTLYSKAVEFSGSHYVMKSLCKMCQLLAEHTKSEFSLPVWKPLLLAVESTRRDWSLEGHPDNLSLHLSHLIHLTGILVSWRDGSRIAPSISQRLHEVVTELVRDSVLQADAHLPSVTLHLVASLFLVSRTPDHTHKEILRYMFDGWSCIGHVTEFIWELLGNEYNHFNNVILGDCLNYCDKMAAEEKNWERLVVFLTKLSVHFHPSSFSTIHSSSLSLPTGNGSVMVMFGTLLEREVKRLIKGGRVRGGGELNYSLLWCALKCIQHSKLIPSHIIESVKKLLSWLQDRLSLNTCDNDDLLLVSQCMITALAINPELINTALPQLAINGYPNSLPILECVLCYYKTVTNEANLQFMDILDLLKTNLNSPSQSIRSTTLQILNCFISDTEDNDNTLLKLLELCLKAETTPATLEAYRDKLICLSKLKYAPYHFSSTPNEIIELPLRLLLGQLYVNFSLVWEPVMELISSYASASELKELFWSVFSETHEYSSASISTNDNKVVASSITETNLSSLNVHDLFEGVAMETRASELGRPDHLNYRRLLWQCMGKFPKAAERKSRLIIPFFLSFIHEEYGLIDDTFTKTQDISKSANDPPTATATTGSVDDEEDGQRDCKENVEDKSEENKAKTVKKRHSDSHSGLNKSLTSMLSLLSKFSNHHGLYCHDELYSIYMKLLMSPEIRIQKLSLSCLKNYREPHFTPYYENLELLLEEDSFREQLLLLNMSSNETVVAQGHVEGLVPILLRLLYGLMRNSSKVGGNSAKKNSILRFVSSCGEREIREMVNIITSSLLYFNDSSHSLSPLSVVPVRRQYGFLQEMRQLLSVVTTQLEPHLPKLLPLFFSLSKSCNTILNTELREKVEVKFIGSLKNIRQLLLGIMSDLLDMFHYVDMSPYINDLLSCAVWPQLVRLHQECLQSPTPLLKLLLVLSQHHELYPIFAAPPPDPSLSPSNCSPILHYVYKCLCSESVSHQVSQTILELTLNLIKPLKEDTSEEQEMDEEEEEVIMEMSEPFEFGLDLLRPFMPTLLSYLSSVIRDKKYKEGKVQLEFNLLSRICGHVTEKSEAELLIELLLPLLSNKLKKECDQILTSVLNLLGPSINIERFYSPLSKLFSTLSKRKSRELLCNIFLKLANIDDSLQPVAQIVGKINSWDPTQIEEPDYEKRQEGFSEGRDFIRAVDLSKKKGCQLVSPILHNALYFVHESDDLSIRDGASSLVSAVIEAVDSERSATFDVLVMGTVIPSLKSGLRAKKETTISEFVDILSQLVRAYSTRFSDLIPLSHSDPEVDFFRNVVHIQLHRRTKAFRKLSTVCSQSNLSQGTMMSYLLPLASHVVFSPLTSRETNMLQEAVNVIAAVASKLSWANYYNLLRHYLHQLPKSLDIHRHIIRVVVAILDQFHFTVSSNAAAPLPDGGIIIEDTTDTNEPIDTNEEEEKMEDEEDKKDKDISRHIYKAIVSIILPSLQSVLTLQSEIPQHRLSHKENNFDAEKLRVPVAMAMTKLLLLLPKPSIQPHMSSLLLKVCQTLRSKAEDVRGLARTTLLKMLQSLGGGYLSLTLQELRDSLTRGYQLHVLGYTVHYLLHGLTNTLRVGDMDSSLHHFKEILIPDLFGHQSDEREVDILISKTPEGKKCKSSHSYGLVARFVSPSLLPSLIQPVQEALEAHPTSKTAAVVEEVLKRMVYGILSNKGLTPSNLLLFIHGTIKRTIPQLQPKPKVSPVSDSVWNVKDSRLLPPKPSRSKPRPVYEGDVGAHLITVFGLQLFDVFLKKEKYKPLSKEMLEMLDPFVPLLTEALESRHVKLLSRTLHCLMRIMKLPLPSLRPQVSELVKELFGVLKHYGYLGAVCSDSNQELVTIAFKAMTQLLHDFASYSLSNEELKLLLSYIEQDVSDYKRQSTAFPLLHIILKRKLLVPEMHEVMKKVSELVVSGDSLRVRSNSRHAVMRFMLNYNLGKKLNSYLDFFVANISYEEQHGRESLLEMLNIIFHKLPEKSLQTHATYFFIPLSSQLINDDSPLCRKMTAQILKTLLKRIGKESRNLIVDIIKDWFAHKKLLHRQLAVQSLGIVIDLEGKDFDRHSVFLPFLSESLSQDLSSITKRGKEDEEEEMEVEETEDDDKMEETGNELQVDITSIDHYLFSVLVTLEKIIINCGTDYTDHSIHSQMRNIWELIFNHLLYPHAWIRYATSKLFGILFASCSVEEAVSVLEDENKTTSSKACCQFFIDSGRLERVKELQEAFIKQLKSPILSNELGSQTVKNLVYIARVLLCLSPRNPMGASEQLERLSHQMDRLCRYERGHHPKESFKRTCVFKWTAAVSTVMGPQVLENWLVKLLPPLTKELNNKDEKKIAGEELHTLAMEVAEHMKGICGRSSFSLALSQISHKHHKT